jgi:hypothetical protein
MYMETQHGKEGQNERERGNTTLGSGAKQLARGFTYICKHIILHLF